MLFRFIFILTLIALVAMLLRHRPRMAVLRQSLLWFTPMVLTGLLFIGLAILHTLYPAQCSATSTGICFAVAIFLSVFMMLSVLATPVGMWQVYRRVREQRGL